MRLNIAYLYLTEKRTVMYRSEFCDVTYLEDLNVVFVEWKNICRQDDYRNPLLYALDIMRNHNDCHYVADTRDGFENEQADTQWLFDVFLPQTALTTCKAIFFIIDNDNNSTFAHRIHEFILDNTGQTRQKMLNIGINNLHW